MSVATVHMCDYVNCPNVAKETCALCLKDTCDRHITARVFASVALRPVDPTQPSQPGVGRPVISASEHEVVLCPACATLVHLPDDADRTALHAALAQALDAYMTTLRLAWMTEPQTPKAPEPYAGDVPTGAISSASTIYIPMPTKPPEGLAAPRGAPVIGKR